MVDNGGEKAYSVHANLIFILLASPTKWRSTQEKQNIKNGAEEWNNDK